MSISVSKKRKNSVVPEQIIIIILLVAFVTMGLITVYKYMVKEPVMTPTQLEIKRLSAAVSSNPANQRSRLLLAFAYQKDKNFERAIQEYNEALKNNPDEMAALYNLGVIYLEQKNYKVAEEQLKRVIKVKESHVLGLIALGEVYIETKRNDEAIKALDQAIRFNPQIARPRILKAQILEKKGNKKGAIQEYREVLKYVPDHEEALSGLKRLK